MKIKYFSEKIIFYQCHFKKGKVYIAKYVQTGLGSFDVTAILSLGWGWCWVKIEIEAEVDLRLRLKWGEVNMRLSGSFVEVSMK